MVIPVNEDIIDIPRRMFINDTGYARSFSFRSITIHDRRVRFHGKKGDNNVRRKGALSMFLYIYY